MRRLNYRNERDTSVYMHYIAESVHRDRQREIEQRLRQAPRLIDRLPRSSVRRRAKSLRDFALAIRSRESLPREAP